MHDPSESSSDKQHAQLHSSTVPDLPEGADAVLKEATRRAGEVLLHYRGNVKQIEYKGDINLVTEADREAEAVVVSLIRDNFPDHTILAEESGKHDARGPGARWRWVIDPLDGTTNFAHALPIFAVSIAVQYDGVTQAGCVYAPALDEVYHAVHGSGATLNGDPIRVSSIDTLKQSLLVTGFPYDRAERVDHYMEVFGKFLKSSQGVVRWGSASIDLCHVACGRLEAFWEEKLHPWDTAAGELIVVEAGGRVTRFDNSPYSIFDQEILATNGHIHDVMVDILRPYSLDPVAKAPHT